MLSLGLNSGITSCKGLVPDLDRGNVLAQSSAPHDFVQDLPCGHVAEIRKFALRRSSGSVVGCLETMGERHHEIVAFISAQQHGLVTIDHPNEPVRSPSFGAIRGPRSEPTFWPSSNWIQNNEATALGAAMHAACTYCQTKGKPVPLEKTRAEPRIENQDCMPNCVDDSPISRGN